MKKYCTACYIILELILRLIFENIVPFFEFIVLSQGEDTA